ncbi:hypothetical protein [Emticicia sp. 17c]
MIIPYVVVDKTNRWFAPQALLPRFAGIYSVARALVVRRQNPCANEYM